MLRIRTTFRDDLRVFTIFHEGKWVTMATGIRSIDATSLMEAGQNHLRLACAIRDQLEKDKNETKSSKVEEEVLG